MGEAFEPDASGVRVCLDTHQVALLDQVVRELLGVLEEPAEGVDELDPHRHDPPAARRRLFPHAYLDPTEEQAEEEWQRMVHHDLVDGKRRNARTLLGGLEALTPAGSDLAGTLDRDDAEAWLGALNDTRLVLGTRLEISDEVDYSGLDPTDPDDAAMLAYGFLTHLTGTLLEALTGDG